MTRVSFLLLLFTFLILARDLRINSVRTDLNCSEYKFLFDSVVNSEANESAWRPAEFSVTAHNPFPEHTLFSYCERHEVSKLNACGLLLGALRKDPGYTYCKAKFHEEALTIKAEHILNANWQHDIHGLQEPTNPFQRIPGKTTSKFSSADYRV